MQFVTRGALFVAGCSAKPKADNVAIIIMTKKQYHQKVYVYCLTCVAVNNAKNTPKTKNKLLYHKR